MIQAGHLSTFGWACILADGAFAIVILRLDPIGFRATREARVKD